MNIHFSISSDRGQFKMLRLDGGGLIPRKNRPESFRETTNKLANEALKNKTPFDFYRTFSRLDATYLNLHTHANFSENLLKQIEISGPNVMGWSNITLAIDMPSPSHTRIVIANIDDNQSLSEKWSGAELISINQILMENCISTEPPGCINGSHS